MDRDHMAARHLYIKYMSPYHIPSQGSYEVAPVAMEEVQHDCSGHQLRLVSADHSEGSSQ